MEEFDAFVLTWVYFKNGICIGKSPDACLFDKKLQMQYCHRNIPEVLGRSPSLEKSSYKLETMYMFFQRDHNWIDYNVSVRNSIR